MTASWCGAAPSAPSSKKESSCRTPPRPSSRTCTERAKQQQCYVVSSAERKSAAFVSK